MPKAAIAELTHPIPYVLVTHVGVQSNPCDNVYNCSIKMRTIQDSAIAEKSLEDLPANFYVNLNDFTDDDDADDGFSVRLGFP